MQRRTFQLGSTTRVSISIASMVLACACGGNPDDTREAESALTSAQYGFEDGTTQGWARSGAPITALASSTTHAASGTHALQVSLSGAAGTANVYVSSPSVPAGKTITFQIYCTATLASVQPYVMQGAAGGWAWTGNWKAGSSLTTNAWNTVTLAVPGGAVTPLYQLGVQLATRSTTTAPRCYIDGVGWPVDAPPDAGTGDTASSDTGSTDAGTDGGSTGDSGAKDTGTSTSKAAALAQRLHGSTNFMFGLSQGQGQTDGEPLDLTYAYLPYGWLDYNTDANGRGAIVDIDVASWTANHHAPSFILYQLAGQGDGNAVHSLNDATFMNGYWLGARTMFQRLGRIGVSAAIVVEPDTFGYVSLALQGGGLSPSSVSSLPAQITLAPECASMPNTIASFAPCLYAMRDRYSPKVAVGLDLSQWVYDDTQTVAMYRAAGAAQGDFISDSVLDRDVGCWEAHTAADGCGNTARTAKYWADSDFVAHLASIKTFTTGFGVPALWWQTPLGVPSTTPGGYHGHYRDNRVQWFFAHVADLVAAGGAGAMFGSGTYPADQQTTLSTDGGQFLAAVRAYYRAPVALK